MSLTYRAAWRGGETRAEVLQLIREAIDTYMDGPKEDGLAVPISSSEGEFVKGWARVTSAFSQ